MSPALSLPAWQTLLTAAPLPLATAGAERGFQITTNVLGKATFPANLQPVYTSPGGVVVFSQKSKKGGKKRGWGGKKKKILQDVPFCIIFIIQVNELHFSNSF